MILEGVDCSVVTRQDMLLSSTIIRDLPDAHCAILSTRGNILSGVTVRQCMNSTRMSFHLEHFMATLNIPYNYRYVLSTRCKICVVLTVGEGVDEIFMSFQWTDSLSGFGIPYNYDRTIHRAGDKWSFWTADHCSNESGNTKHA